MDPLLVRCQTRPPCGFIPDADAQAVLLRLFAAIHHDEQESKSILPILAPVALEPCGLVSNDQPVQFGGGEFLPPGMVVAVLPLVVMFLSVGAQGAVPTTPVVANSAPG